MHIFGSVEDVSAAFAERPGQSSWRVYDLTMVIPALLHGGNGVRWMIDDYVHSDRRLIAFSTLYTTLFVLLVVGSLILLTFQYLARPRPAASAQCAEPPGSHPFRGRARRRGGIERQLQTQ